MHSKKIPRKQIAVDLFSGTFVYERQQAAALSRQISDPLITVDFNNRNKALQNLIALQTCKNNSRMRTEIRCDQCGWQNNTEYMNRVIFEDKRGCIRKWA